MGRSACALCGCLDEGEDCGCERGAPMEPTEPGYYRYRRPDSYSLGWCLHFPWEVVQVTMQAGLGLVVLRYFDERFYLVDDMEGEWGARVEMPGEEP